MKKSELKNLIKPLVKECIMEVMIEEKLLTEVVSQVTLGLTSKQATPIQTTKKVVPNLQEQRAKPKQTTSQVISNLRKDLMDSIGRDAYNGVDLFEGTEPLRESGREGSRHMPDLLGDDVNDAGVDISSLIGDSSKIWNKIKK